MEAADGQWPAVGGDIVGFLGVDNPRANTNTLLVLQAVSSFVVNQIGMNAHLTKPVEPDHLYKTLGELIWEAEN